jgi:hypothetical protein
MPEPRTRAVGINEDGRDPNRITGTATNSESPFREATAGTFSAPCYASSTWGPVRGSPRTLARPSPLLALPSEIYATLEIPSQIHRPLSSPTQPESLGTASPAAGQSPSATTTSLRNILEKPSPTPASHATPSQLPMMTQVAYSAHAADTPFDLRHPSDLYCLQRVLLPRHYHGSLQPASAQDFVLRRSIYSVTAKY